MIPTYDTYMLPMLKILSDNKEHTLSELANLLAEEFKISEEERKAYLPSGKSLVFRSRVGWAKTYLGKALLLDTPKRATYKITPRGLDLLKEKPAKIDTKLLLKYKEFVKFQAPSIQSKKNETPADNQIEVERTPEEILEESYQILEDQLAKELQGEIMAKPPDFFEKLVIDLLLKMGYGGSRKDAGQAMGKSGDGGIDGTIKEDVLGLDIIYIQAKRYTNSVPISHIRDFAGALLSKKAKKGIFITTSSFPKSAYEYVQLIEHKIVLIDGERLTSLMILEYQLKSYMKLRRLTLIISLKMNKIRYLTISDQNSVGQSTKQVEEVP
jgi:restriction system protein